MVRNNVRPNTEPYQCIPDDAIDSDFAIDLVRQNPFSLIERLYGVGDVGVEDSEEPDLKWQLMGVAIGRGRKVFDLEFGADSTSVDMDEDALIALIMRTRDVYIPGLD